MQVTPLSSGYSLGSSNWIIQSHYEKVSYVSGSSLLTTHPQVSVLLYTKKLWRIISVVFCWYGGLGWQSSSGVLFQLNHVVFYAAYGPELSEEQWRFDPNWPDPDPHSQPRWHARRILQQPGSVEQRSLTHFVCLLCLLQSRDTLSSFTCRILFSSCLLTMM